MTREEALQRIVDNNFAGEYGFDLQILIDCMVVAREIILNSQFPSEDCISRKVVLDLVEDMTDQFGVEHRVITEGVISMLPSVTPKPKTGVLDKIRAEIHATAEMHEDGDYYLRDEWIDEIIDKYKAESENRE